MHPKPLFGGLLAALTLASGAAEARVKLLTLPVRSKVEVHLEHASATLVEEERVVPVVKGHNHIDFSWANTRIDPDTIVFRVLGPGAEDPGEVRVLSVSYPPGENALVWTVYASRAGAARVRISYLLGGLSRTYSYRAIADAAEKTLTLKRYLELANQANEGFGQATLHMADGRRVDSPIELAQTRKTLVERSREVPVDKTFTADVATYGYLDAKDRKLRIPMHYVLTNDRAHQLGNSALPTGKVRIFQLDRRGAEVFLGEDWGRTTPIGDQMRLFLGTAQDVVVRRYIDKQTAHPVKGHLRNLEVVIRYEIESFKKSPVRLDVVEDLAALRRELGLNAGRRGELRVLEGTTFPGGVDAAASGLERLVVHQPLPAKRGDDVKKIVARLHVRFDNEW